MLYNFFMNFVYEGYCVRCCKVLLIDGYGKVLKILLRRIIDRLILIVVVIVGGINNIRFMFLVN